MIKKLIIIFILLVSGTCFAANIYVDRADVDSNFSNEALNCSTPSDTDYDPATRQCGSGASTVYSSLSAADSNANAGDTIYVRSGTYSTNADFFWSSKNGSSGAKITVSKYSGDTTGSVIFTGDASSSNVCLYLNHNYHVFDGIKFLGTFNDITNAVVLLGGNYNEIKNCIFESFTASAIRVDNSNGSTGSYNLIHDNTVTTIGSACGGDGCGAFVFVRGGQFNWVYSNTINGVGHAAIDVEDYPPDAYQAKYNKFYNNTIDQTNGGGGIYLNSLSEYNLIENNTIRNVGKLTGLTQNKAGILVSGSKNNTVRKNKIYDYGVDGSESHRGLMIKTSVAFNNKNTKDNLIHNNIIYKGYGLAVYVREDSAGHEDPCSDYELKDNTFANNVIYLAPTSKIVSANYVGAYTSAGYYALFIQQELGSGCSAWATYANNNEFSNNYIYTGNHGEGENDNWIGYYYGSGGHSNAIGTEEDNYPDDFNDGTHITTATPGFVNPDNYNFKLSAGSALDNSGIAINDTNGSYVESNYPGYGWSSLVYARWPIGVYESGGSIEIGVGNGSIIPGGDGSITW